MSWDHRRYLATCAACGRTGVRIESSDDWMRTEIAWEGFAREPDDPYLVERKRIAPGDRARCECGSTKIVVGDKLPS